MLVVLLKPRILATPAVARRILRTTQFTVTPPFQAPTDIPTYTDYYLTPDEWIQARELHQVPISPIEAKQFLHKAADIFDLNPEVPQAVAGGLLLEAWHAKQLVAVDTAPEAYAISEDAYITLQARETTMYNYIIELIEKATPPARPTVHIMPRRQRQVRVVLPRSTRQKLKDLSNMFLGVQGTRRDSVALDWLLQQEALLQGIHPKHS